MKFQERLQHFAELGEVMRKLTSEQQSKYDEAYAAAKRNAYAKNSWFSERFVDEAVKAWGAILTPDNLWKWTDPYADKFSEENELKVGVILAGNIPLVGFHDVLSVAAGGFNVMGKLSSKDDVLLPFFIDLLKDIDARWKEKIELSNERWKGIDAVIATGSDNSARYFEYYFGDNPHIIRKNRTSVAVLNGDETKEELRLLGKDIFTFYGLGCRNVSKLYIPDDFDLSCFFEAVADYGYVTENNKYMNNYEYNRAIYLLNREPDLLDNNFLLLKPDKSLHAPTGVLFTERYENEGKVLDELNSKKEELQCVVVSRGDVPFGQTQKPELWDYADNVNTLEFLADLNCD